MKETAMTDGAFSAPRGVLHPRSVAKANQVNPQECDTQGLLKDSSPDLKLPFAKSGEY